MDRRVELTVDGDEELEDLKLLIKLSYTNSYTHDGGLLLPFQTRLPLAVRVDALEFVKALDEIVESLPRGLNILGALLCMEIEGQLPPTLETHAGMIALQKEADEGQLPPTLETHAGMIALQKEADMVLATTLGPVSGMFEEGEELVGRTMLPLRDIVSLLPAYALRRLLASDVLELQLKNEAFAHLRAWLYQSPNATDKAQRLALFKQFAPLLRYHHTTLDFVANVVTTCPLMEASGLLLSVLRSAIVQRDALPTVMLLDTVERGPRNRGLAPTVASWELNAS